MTLSRFVHVFRQRLQALFRKERLDDELDQELQFHLEQLEKEHIEAGMSAEEARGAARRALGNMAVFKEECRDERRVSWFYDFRQDVQYGARVMRKHPGFTIIAAISLALGIGGNSAILHTGAAVLFGGLPLPDGEALVIVQTVLGPTNPDRGHATVPEYVAWKNHNSTFESMGVSVASNQDLAWDEKSSAPERLVGQAVTPSLFDTLKVQPHLGRLFRNDETAAPVVILSHQLWQGRFAGDAEILGRRILMNGNSLEVIGVMPPGFLYPNQNSAFWVPLAFTRFQLEGSAPLFMVTGRLKTGITVEEAQADLERVVKHQTRAFPDRRRISPPWVVPLREYWFGWIRLPLVTLEGALIFVLLIACANVSILMLSRVPARQPEVALRLLMGAGRGRIVRQFLTESLMLSLIGGTLGIAVAYWGVSSLGSLPPTLGGAPVSRLNPVVGIPVLVALLALLSSVLFGLIPALAAFRAGNDFRQAAVHRRRRGPSDILVSLQIGLALILLIASGLLINSFIRLALDDPGFDPKGILTFQYRIAIGKYLNGRGSFRGMQSLNVSPPTRDIQRVHERLRSLPGAESVAGSSVQPVNGLALPIATLHIDGRPADPPESPPATAVYFLVTENFFTTMKTPILRGREFDGRDTAATKWVAVINETMANRFWPGQDPIGKRFTVDAALGERPREVIGVVRDIPLRYIRNRPRQAVAYTLYLQQPERYEGVNANMFGQMIFFIRTQEDPLSLAPAARQAVAEIDPDSPLTGVQNMAEVVVGSLRTRRYYVSTLSVFALMATLLAGVGVYGVLSFSVSRRTREIGVRMAMGATTRDIVELVGAGAVKSVVLGLFIGVAGSLAATRLLEAQLWGITPTDPPTFIGFTVFLTVVAVMACFIPARRAMRVNPSEALRVE